MASATAETTISTSSSPSAVIIGGGIAGCAVALFLHRIGIRVSIYEGHPKRNVPAGGMQIAPNGMNILKELNLDALIRSRGAECSEYVMRNSWGEVLSKVKLNANNRYGHNAVLISRSNLHLTLVEEIERQHIHIEYNKRLKSILINDDTGVKVEFHDGAIATATILIGADGAHSCTRTCLFPSAPPAQPVGLIGFGGFVPLSLIESKLTVSNVLPAQGEMSFTFGKLGFFGQARVGKDELGRDQMMWWANLPDTITPALAKATEDSINQKNSTNDTPSSSTSSSSSFSSSSSSSSSHIDPWSLMIRSQLNQLTNDEIKSALKSVYHDWYTPIPQLIESDSLEPGTKMTRVHICDVQDLPMYYHNRVVLIGDAAHAMSPNSGQGASQALEDSMMLAKLLKNKMKIGSASALSLSDLNEVFSAFQSHRKPRVDKINAKARRMASQKKDELGAIGCWIRDKMLKFFFWAFGDKMFDEEMGYNIHWQDDDKADTKATA